MASALKHRHEMREALKRNGSDLAHDLLGIQRGEVLVLS